MRNSILILTALTFLTACKVSKVEKQFNKGHYDLVIEKLENKSKHTPDENFLIAESYRKSNRLKYALPFFKKAVDGHVENEIAYLHYAQSLEANEQYKEAEKVLKDYLEEGEDEHVLSLAEGELAGLIELEKLIEKGTYYRVKNLSDINTPNTEYSPIYNNGRIYFTSNRDGGKTYLATGTPFTHIYHVESKGARVDLNSLEPLSPIFNDPNTNEGSIAISKDGTSIIFAKGNPGKPNGADDVNLYFSRYRNGEWSEPRILSLCKPKAWDSSPALSPDGRTLYFASNREGGYGGSDIYVAKLNRRGRWVDVRNMGDAINTPGNESFPYVSESGKLYFSSDGHAGFGQLDIFEATREKGVITVKNLGAPINSASDDFGYHEYDVTRGFFSSNRKGGKGDDDIYTYINDDPDLKIVNYYLTGVTVTLDDGGAEIILPNSKVTLLDANNQIVDETFTGSDGKYDFVVYPEEDYYLVGQKASYFTTREPFSTMGKSVDKATLKDVVTNITFDSKIILDPIVIDKAIVLENIYYDFDKWDIRPDAAIELNKLVVIMEDNPDISIELSSHTDSRADDSYNMTLSQRRAKSAVEYIISQGIAPNRLAARGYGESHLIVKNAQTEEEHQVNRRTEFKVTRYNQQIENDSDVDETDRFFDDDEEETETGR